MQAGAANLSAELFCKNYEGQDKGIQHRNHVFFDFSSSNDSPVLFNCTFVNGKCQDSGQFRDNSNVDSTDFNPFDSDS